MNKLVRDGIFSAFLSGVFGLYIYLLGVKSSGKQKRDAINLEITSIDDDMDECGADTQ